MFSGKSHRCNDSYSFVDILRRIEKSRFSRKMNRFNLLLGLPDSSKERNTVPQLP